MSKWDKALETALAQNREAARQEKQAIIERDKASKISYVVNIDPTKRYVLVVEDSSMISEILEQTLLTMGISSVIAHNGRIAVERFTEFMHKG